MVLAAESIQNGQSEMKSMFQCKVATPFESEAPSDVVTSDRRKLLVVTETNRGDQGETKDCEQHQFVIVERDRLKKVTNTTHTLTHTFSLSLSQNHSVG